MEKRIDRALRERLVTVAEREAKRNFHGDTTAGIGNLQPLQDYFAGEDEMTESDWNEDWGGAFVYHCLSLCGMKLPPHYPDPRVHACFARAASWWQYARLPKIRLFHSMAEQPQIGDLIFFQTGDRQAGMVGILLACTEEGLLLAAGNYHNHSAIVERPYDEHLLGWMSLGADA